LAVLFIFAAWGVLGLCRLVLARACWLIVFGLFVAMCCCLALCCLLLLAVILSSLRAWFYFVVVARVPLAFALSSFRSSPVTSAWEAFAGALPARSMFLAVLMQKSWPA
jgi:hypothetical protein